MTKYLVSFPSEAMVVPEGELPAVSEAAHAVVREAKAAGVWVFGGGIDGSVQPVLVSGDGTLIQGTYPQTRSIEGGYAILDCPSRADAIHWATRFAVACRCAQELREFMFNPES